MFVKVLEAPTEDDWLKVKQRALVTVGKDANTPPTKAWKHAILEARHSPIRRLWYTWKPSLVIFSGILTCGTNVI